LAASPAALYFWRSPVVVKVERLGAARFITGAWIGA
jgi:hypothetical protein